MKLIAKQTVKINGKRYRAGESVDVDIADNHPARALFEKVNDLKEIKRQAIQTKEDKKAYSVEKKGSWYTVYNGDEVVDKFQGAKGLEKYGLA